VDKLPRNIGLLVILCTLVVEEDPGVAVAVVAVVVVVVVVVGEARGDT
jgi:hypothetical protein